MGGPAPAEVERFCREQWPRLTRAMWLQCGDAAVAEDIAQEALVRAWERWGEVSRLARPDQWVMRVAVNLATSRFRRLSAERRARRLMHVAPAGADASDSLAIRTALLALPPRQRAAVLLRHEMGYSVSEAAPVLGCAEGTVKALTHQGLLGMRRRLGEDQLEDEGQRHR